MILSWEINGISFSRHFDTRHLLTSATFSLKLSAGGTMANTATLLWVDFNDSATFIISVAISASGLFKEGSFAPAWKM